MPEDNIYVIEHDIDIIKAADHIIGLGLGAGDLCCIIIYQGAPHVMKNCLHSVTVLRLKLF